MGVDRKRPSQARPNRFLPTNERVPSASPIFTENLRDSLKNIGSQNDAIETVNGQSNVATGGEDFVLFVGQFHAGILSPIKPNGKASASFVRSDLRTKEALANTFKVELK